MSVWDWVRVMIFSWPSSLLPCSDSSTVYLMVGLYLMRSGLRMLSMLSDPCACT